jgi:hypothetical protein
MATTRPVDRIKRVSKEVKARSNGVNITPPPTPAITATTAIKTLIANEMTMMSMLETVPCPPKDVPSIRVSRKR